MQKPIAQSQDWVELLDLISHLPAADDIKDLKMTNSDSSDLQKSSDGAAFAALIFLILFFLVVVGFGWWKIISPFLDFIPTPFDQVVAGIAGAFCALFAVVLAKYVAAERVKIYALAEKKPRLFAWFGKVWPFLFMLLFLSALGTARTIFSLSQEKSVLSDEVSTTAQKLRNLDLVIHSKFKEIPAYTDYLKAEQSYSDIRRRAETDLNQFMDEMARVQKAADRILNDQRAEVEVVWRNFANEVQNPANCGIGPKALSHFKELQNLLGGPELLRAGGGCNKVTDQQVLDKYRESVNILVEERFTLAKLNCNFSTTAINRWTDLRNQWDQVPALPDANLNCEEIKDVLATIKRDTTKLIDQIAPPASENPVALTQFIDKARTEIRSQTGKLDKLVLESSAKSTEEVIGTLRESWELYRKLVADGQVVAAPVQFELPSDIKREEVENIQSLTNILRILAARWDHFMTYFTLFSAVLLDLILIAFFYRHLSSRVRTAPRNPYDSYVVGDNPFDIK